MPHVARLPPPPVFNDRRLVCLIAFCKLQFIDQSFGVCVFCLEICIFLVFVVNSLRVRRYWQSAKLIANMCPKCIKKYVIIHQNTCKIHPKSTKMVPRSAQKAALAASLFQVSKKAAARLRNGCHCGATWAMLGVILGPAGRQGAPKIELFGTKSHQNLKK